MAFPDFTQEQMEEATKKYKERKAQELADLKARSKPLYELVVTEKFIVESVVANSHATYISPNSEMMIGGRSPSYKGGFTSRVSLQVTPDDSRVPVRNLIFEGISTVRAGEYISTQIPTYEEINDPAQRDFSDRYGPKKVFYLPRELKSEELAIELVIISPVDESILRTERAVDYNRFIKR